jgi:hypothetical protein
MSNDCECYDKFKESTPMSYHDCVELSEALSGLDVLVQKLKQYEGHEKDVEAAKKVDDELRNVELNYRHTITSLLMALDECNYVGYSRLTIHCANCGTDPSHVSHRYLLRCYRAFMHANVIRIGEDELRRHYRAVIRDFVRVKQRTFKKIMKMIEKLVHGCMNKPLMADYLSGIIQGCKGPDVLKGLRKNESGTMEQVYASYIFLTAVAEEYYSVIDDNAIHVKCQRCKDCSLWLVVRMWFASYVWYIALGAMRNPDVMKYVEAKRKDLTAA